MNLLGENLGVQIKVWLPDELYSVIREMAAGRGGNVSQVVRGLISVGLTHDAAESANDLVAKRLTEGMAELRAAVIEAAKPVSKSADDVGSALDHLERLTFFIAQNVAFVAAANESSIEQILRRNYPNDRDAADEAVKTWFGKHQGIAHERIRKALREPKPKLDEEL